MDAVCGRQTRKIIVLPVQRLSEKLNEEITAGRRMEPALIERRDSSLNEVEMKRSFWPVMRFIACTGV